MNPWRDDPEFSPYDDGALFDPDPDTDEDEDEDEDDEEEPIQCGPFWLSVFPDDNCQPDPAQDSPGVDRGVDRGDPDGARGLPTGDSVDRADGAGPPGATRHAWLSLVDLGAVPPGADQDVQTDRGVPADRRAARTLDGVDK